MPLFIWLVGEHKGEDCRGRRLNFIGHHYSDRVLQHRNFSGWGRDCDAFVWPLRKRVRWMLWGLVAAIVGLAMVMKAPSGLPWPMLILQADRRVGIAPT